MRYLKSGLMLLSAALMSGGCEQSASKDWHHALAAAKAKMPERSESRAVTLACSAQLDNSDELLRLKQQLQQTQQLLAQSNAALVAAKNQLKGDTSAFPSAEVAVAADSLAQRQKKLAVERRITTATSNHVTQLEQRLSDQDLQLSKLHKSLLVTEAGCREIADELAQKVFPS